MPEPAAQPINEPRPEKTPGIEWRARCGACLCSCKPRIEIGGKIGNQTTAKLEDKAGTRELGERTLQAVFNRHEDARLLACGLRRKAVEDFTLGPRAGAPIAACAANDATQGLIVAFDHGGAGKAGLDRAEPYRHLSFPGTCVMLGQLGPVEAGGHGRNVRKDRPYRLRRSCHHKTLLESRPPRARLFRRGRRRGHRGARRFAGWREGLKRSRRRGSCRRRDSRGFRCACRDHALNRVGEAGARRLIIDQHGACATYAVLASEMGPRQAAMLAQEIGQMGARLDQRLDLPSVHAQRDWRHGASTCTRARVTTAVAMLCSTASSSPIDCASAWLTASVEAAIFPSLATCCANDAIGLCVPRRPPRKMLATPDSGSNTAAALASANSPVLRQNL